MNPIVLIKTIGGEYFMGESYTINNEDPIILKNVRVISIQMTPRGPGMSLVPVVPFATKEPETMEFAKVNVIACIKEADIQKDLVDGYKTQITGIQTVSKPNIII